MQTPESLTFVQYVEPGDDLNPNIRIEEIDEADLRNVNPRKGEVAFLFFNKFRTYWQGFALESEPFNVSALNYIDLDAKLYTLPEVQIELPDQIQVMAMMTTLDLPMVIRYGENFYPFKFENRLISPEELGAKAGPTPHEKGGGSEDSGSG